MKWVAWHDLNYPCCFLHSCLHSGGELEKKTQLTQEGRLIRRQARRSFSIKNPACHYVTRTDLSQRGQHRTQLSVPKHSARHSLEEWSHGCMMMGWKVAPTTWWHVEARLNAWSALLWVQSWWLDSQNKQNPNLGHSLMGPRIEEMCGPTHWLLQEGDKATSLLVARGLTPSLLYCFDTWQIFTV